MFGAFSCKVMTKSMLSEYGAIFIGFLRTSPGQQYHKLKLKTHLWASLRRAVVLNDPFKRCSAFCPVFYSKNIKGNCYFLFFRSISCDKVTEAREKAQKLNFMTN